MSVQEKLVDILAELEEEVFNATFGKVGSRKTMRRTHKRACADLIFSKYNDALMVLRRILDEKEEARELQDEMFRIARGTKWGAEEQKLVKRESTLKRLLELDIKFLYIICHQIYKIFLHCKPDIDLSELKRVAFLRSKLIAHIHETPLFEKSSTIPSAMLFDAELENVRLLLHSFGMTKKEQATISRMLKVLVKELIPHIPELATEKNQWEQLNLIYTNLNALDGTGLMGKAKGLLERAGTRTESPSKLARILLMVLKEYRKAARI